MKKTLLATLGGSRRTRLAEAAAAETEDQDSEDDEDQSASSSNEAADDQSGEEASDDEDPDGDDQEKTEGADDDDAAEQAAIAATRRCASIITSKAGLANPKAAHKLAFEADLGTGTYLSAKGAISLLESIGPAGKQSGLADRMSAYSGTPGPDSKDAKGGETGSSMNARMKRRNAAVRSSTDA